MFGLVPFAKNISKDDDFNSLFNIFDEPFFHNTLLPLSATKSFKVDVKDLGSAYELTAELPGIKKENISLNYDKGYLTIKTVVDKKDEKPAEAQGEKKQLIKNNLKNIYAVNVIMVKCNVASILITSMKPISKLLTKMVF